MFRRAQLLGLATCLSLAACGDSTDEATPGPLVADGLPASCNPLRTAGACLLPFPSAVYLDPDETTPTGLRVALTPDQFPRNNYGVAFDPARLNRADGFSPNAEILAYFPERLDPASLPADADASGAADSATVIVDMESGERVAHLAELDAQVRLPEDRQALILRPLTRLAAGHRYAVAVTRRARTLAGAAPASPAGFAAALAGDTRDPMIARQSARMPAILSALGGAGVARGDLVLAWDFVTASDESLTATTRSMVDQTVAELGEEGLGYTITSVEDNFDLHTLRRIRGTFTVPQFVSQTDPAVAEVSLAFGQDGSVTQQGTYEAPFTLILPRTAENTPVRLLVFGHGFLGSGESEIGGKEGSYLQDFADQYGYALVATDWTGLSHFEGVDAKGSGAASEAVADMNHMGWISDRLHQSIVNVVTLARVARGALAKDPAVFVGAESPIDTSRVDYFGISLGGVMGSAVAAYSPDLQRAVLNVGAAQWSTLLQRSTNWLLFKLIVDGSYPERLDQQVLVDVMQSYFDPIDGMTTAPSLLSTKTASGLDKQVLLQIAVNDAQVTNLASEILARTMGLPLLDDSPLAVWGLPPAGGPLASALTAWDTHVDAPPAGNIPASAATDNHAHTAIRSLPALMDQIDGFLRDQGVQSHCDGPCDPE